MRLYQTKKATTVSNNQNNNGNSNNTNTKQQPPTTTNSHPSPPLFGANIKTLGPNKKRRTVRGNVNERRRWGGGVTSFLQVLVFKTKPNINIPKSPNNPNDDDKTTKNHPKISPPKKRWRARS